MEEEKTYISEVAQIGSGWLIPHDNITQKGSKFLNITKGVEFRRWLVKGNIGISNLLTRCTGEDIWFRELSMIK